MAQRVFTRDARAAGLLLAAFVGLPAPVAAREEASLGGSAPERPRTARDGRRTVRRLPANLLGGALAVPHADNLAAFLVGATAAGFSSFGDQHVREATQSYSWGQTFETGAGPVWSGVFVVSMFTAGRIASGVRFRSMTYDVLDAAVVNFGYTGLLKVAVGRERPNGQDSQSFPSGHTSNAFAMATVAERHYGWKLGLPAYLLAGVVGASRIEQDKHYLSDVVAGAALGFVVGRTVVRFNGRADEGDRAPALSVSPVIGHGRRGVRVAMSF